MQWIFAIFQGAKKQEVCHFLSIEHWVIAPEWSLGQPNFFIKKQTFYTIVEYYAMPEMIF